MMKTFLVVLLIFLPVFVKSAPEVRLPVGVVRGSDKAAVTTSKPYHVYYGIPFARPPIGDLRFKPPQKYVAIDPNKVISSDRFRASCIQSEFEDTQSEDCLHLNIFTPNAPSGRFDARPEKKVMVWIHGGGFTEGAADFYSPARMVTDYDVIVVTIQYRLGILGFLSTGDDTLPGNLGLRDQIEAIRWTKDNIGQFGGDGDDITIFGESAGAASVSILSISPLSKGLFTKAIMQSGTALSPWAVTDYHVDTFNDLAKKSGCRSWFYFPGIKDFYNRRILDCLEKLPLEKFLEKEKPSFNVDSKTGGSSKPGTKEDSSDEDSEEDSTEKDTIVDPSFFDSSLKTAVPYGPVVDGDLLPKHPEALLADKEYLQRNGVLDRKYIIGANNNEALYLVDYLYALYDSDFPPPFFDKTLIERSNKVIASEFFGLPVTSDLVSYVNLMYNYPEDNEGKPPVQGRLDLMTDTLYIVPSVQFANALVSSSPDTQVYLYLMDYYPDLKDPKSVLRGSTHGLDIFYLFDEILELSKVFVLYSDIYSPSSIPVMQYFRSLFTNMAIFGSPTGNGNTPWPRYTMKEQKYLVIDEVAQVRERMYAHRVSLWTDFLPRKYKDIFMKVKA